MSEFKDYPSSAYRGLTNLNCIDMKFRVVLGTAFAFDGNHRNENNYDELSINWDDDEESLQFMKRQKKEGSEKLKYSIGIARIPTNKMKEIKLKYKGNFLFERKPIEGNIYHGNILLNYDNIPKQVKQLIVNELASGVDLTYIYDEETSSWDIL